VQRELLLLHRTLAGNADAEAHAGKL